LLRRSLLVHVVHRGYESRVDVSQLNELVVVAGSLLHHVSSRPDERLHDQQTDDETQE
jgi:hypothetical protein